MQHKPSEILWWLRHEAEKWSDDMADHFEAAAELIEQQQETISRISEVASDHLCHGCEAGLRAEVPALKKDAKAC